VTQMRSYLHHYDQVIQQSIQQAKKLQTPPLFNFLGFTRQPRPAATQPTTRHTPHPPRLPTATSGENRIRKHTRWRSIATQQLQSVRDFFSTSPPT
jgi:hypothetical protein